MTMHSLASVATIVILVNLFASRLGREGGHIMSVEPAIPPAPFQSPCVQSTCILQYSNSSHTRIEHDEVTFRGLD